MDEPAFLPAVLELDDTVELGEQRVVLAAPHVLAGLEPRSALANEDGATGDALARERFHAQALGVAVATVTGASLTFLVCHFRFSLLSSVRLSVDRRHGDSRKRLAMPARPAVLLAALLLEYEEFLAASLLGDGRGDARAIDVGLSERGVSVFVDEHDLVETDRIADLSFELFDTKRSARLHFFLFPARLTAFLGFRL